VVSQLARDAGGPAIRFAALIYPGTDMTATDGSMETNSKGYFL
jgi:acetyl esterase/lipase